jgi:hypothetical protein
MPAKKKKPSNLPSPEVIAALQRIYGEKRDEPMERVVQRVPYDAYSGEQYPQNLPQGMPRPVTYQYKEIQKPLEYPLKTHVNMPVTVDNGRQIAMPQEFPAIGPLPQDAHETYYYKRDKLMRELEDSLKGPLY